MRREGFVYVTVASVSFALCLFLAWGTRAALQSNWSLLDCLPLALTGLVFAGLFVLYATLSYLFLGRAVREIRRSGDQYAIFPSAGNGPVQANSLRLVRYLRSQFGAERSKPAFAIINVAGMYWVCTVECIGSAK